MSTDQKYTAQQQYIKRQEARDFVRVSVWVPKADRKELIDIAAEMCHDAKPDDEK